MSTRTRFEKEAKGNSEMVYSAPSRVTEWGLARISLGSKEDVNKKEQELI